MLIVFSSLFKYKAILNKICRTLLSVVLGVYFTHYCIEQNILTPVLASALSGLIGSLTLYPKWNIPKDIGAAIYCGSFVGMGSILTTVQLLPASILTCVLMLMSSHIFKGFGGKLGFTAYVASVLTALVIALYQQHFSNDFLLHFNPRHQIIPIAYIVLATTIGFYTTVYIHHRLGKSAVLASALPSFVVGFLAYANVENVDILVATFFSASFAGMLSNNLLPKKRFPLLVFTLIMITIFLKTFLGKFGGSLGTMAFVSVLLIHVLFSEKKKAIAE